MKHLKLILISLLLVGVGLVFAPTPSYATIDCSSYTGNQAEECARQKKLCDSNPEASTCKEWENNPEQNISHTFQNIVNILLFMAGIMAIIVIIMSGIKFVTSRGDSGAITKARQTLIYAVAGLVITILAFAIVNFMISALGTTNTSSGGSSGGSSSGGSSGGSTPTVETQATCRAKGMGFDAGPPPTCIP